MVAFRSAAAIPDTCMKIAQDYIAGHGGGVESPRVSENHGVGVAGL
jgi:hypothetical protein